MAFSGFKLTISTHVLYEYLMIIIEFTSHNHKVFIVTMLVSLVLVMLLIGPFSNEEGDAITNTTRRSRSVYLCQLVDKM